MAGFVQDEVIVVKDKSVEKVDFKKKQLMLLINSQASSINISLLFLYSVVFGKRFKERYSVVN